MNSYINEVYELGTQIPVRKKIELYMVELGTVFRVLCRLCGNYVGTNKKKTIII